MVAVGCSWGAGTAGAPTLTSALGELSCDFLSVATFDGRVEGISLGVTSFGASEVAEGIDARGGASEAAEGGDARGGASEAAEGGVARRGASVAAVVVDIPRV